MKPFGPWSDDSNMLFMTVVLLLGSGLAYGAIGLWHG